MTLVVRGIHRGILCTVAVHRWRLLNVDFEIILLSDSNLTWNA